jgi:hypothetical protein
VAGRAVSAALADCCKFGSSPEQSVALGGPSGAIQRGQALACARIGQVSRIAYVSGRPGAGKSSLAVPLAAELGYSLVTKDLIKETLHDALFVPGDGEIDEAWSLRLGAASFELLWALAARAGDMVIEANFHPHSAGTCGMYRWLRDDGIPEGFQILCLSCNDSKGTGE